MAHASTVPAEAPFLFSVAALSASVAGLAGLVAAFRRGEGLRPIDLFRLQEIVEFAFANSLISLTIVALATAFGVLTAARIAGVGILAYLVGNGFGLYLRSRRFGLDRSRAWLVLAGGANAVGIVLAVATAATGAVLPLQLLLILLLARPMTAFLLVLSSLETTNDGVSERTRDMATDLTIALVDQPGSLAKASDALGRAGVNIDGACGYVCETQGVYHVLVHDLEGGRRALMNGGFTIEDERRVVATPVENQPGAAAALLRKVAEAGVNVDLLYMTLDGRLVLGGSDIAGIERALAG